MSDLTKGNEGKLIFYFTLPMLIGNVFQQLYNTVDSIIVGRTLGKEALGAVGVSFPIIFLLASLIMGITMGSTILIAQYYGAKDMKKLKKTIDTTYIILFVSSLIVTIVGIVFSGSILRILGTPQEMIKNAQIYLNITFIGIFGMFGYNSISAILRGLGDSKTPLYFLIISTVINIVLDLVFILVFHWGVAGAAWATIIAQACSFAFGIYYLNKNHDILKFNIKTMKFDKEIFKKSLKIGLPSGVQQMLFSLGMMGLQGMVNSYGTDTVAAYTAASKIDSFSSMPIMNFGAAISAFVGQNLGANKPERVKNGYKATLLMSTVISLGVTIIVILFRRPLLAMFNTDPEVIKVGVRYLVIIPSFYTVISFMFITSGVIRGAGDTLIPMFISILTLWFIRLPIAYILSSKIGSDGLWWGTPVAWTMGAILTFGYFLKGKWKSKAVTVNNLREATEM
ncbi:MATE family efflux transporter [Clostridium malenominatum]|uniref:Probable multidrug resistance protein NorM n=1 Tax=Clostridium malenominatum TaxID=1539 RepID=A0ABP3UDZ1_9CLOT